MRIDSICKSFGSRVVMKDFSLDVRSKSITCITGPSGCGKTTLLNMIAGIVQPDCGAISRESDELGPTSYLFQEPRLLPWTDALGNVSLVLGGDEGKALGMLDAVGLRDSVHKFPDEMSGGMRQRVAMARAFAFKSNVLLMDEPFQNLDTKLRHSLTRLFLDLWENDRRTVVWVTHDIAEACLVADDIVCLSSDPMKVSFSMAVDVPRDQRTLENMAGTQAKIYRMLID